MAKRYVKGRQVRAGETAQTSFVNIAGAAMLAMHGRDLEAIPALAGFEDAVADAAVQATHEEVFIPLLDEMTFDDLFAGRAGLVVVSTVELDDLVSEGEEDYGSREVGG